MSLAFVECGRLERSTNRIGQEEVARREVCPPSTAGRIGLSTELQVFEGR